MWMDKQIDINKIKQTNISTSKLTVIIMPTNTEVEAEEVVSTEEGVADVLMEEEVTIMEVEAMDKEMHHASLAFVATK